MNIVYVAHRIPYPPTKGDKIRAFHQIRELGRRHTVHVVCGILAGDDIDSLRELARHCASVDATPEPKGAVRVRAARAVLSGCSHTALAHASPRLTARVIERCRVTSADVLVAATVATAENVRRVAGVCKALDFVDVTSGLFEQAAEYRRFPGSMLLRLEAARLRRYEQDVAASFDCMLFSSESEAAAFGPRRFDRVHAVVGNGVDLEYFAPTPGGPTSMPKPLVVFTGTMDYFPNVDAVLYFARSILPRVRAAAPQTPFAVVGRNPPAAIRRLTRDRSVTVTGTVPDVREHLAASAVAVAPFRIARGVQNKVIEALAMGIPVVGTSLALQGFNLTDNDGVRRADDPATFAREVIALLGDPDRRARCAGQARRYVEAHHRWDAQGERLSAVLEAVVENRRHVARKLDGGR